LMLEADTTRGGDCRRSAGWKREWYAFSLPPVSRFGGYPRGGAYRFRTRFVVDALAPAGFVIS
jgi:hypothetical protein